jgi:CheY-like chemotaxis protein
VKALILASNGPQRQPLARAIADVLQTPVEVQDPQSADPATIFTVQKPDVVLVDLDLAHGRGLEIIRQIHELEQEFAPVIVALASGPSLRARADCMEAGAIYLFDKSCEQEWLLGSLESIKHEIEEEGEVRKER